MRRSISVTTLLIMLVINAGIAAAQTDAPLSISAVAIACAPPTTVTATTAPLHILGAQDTMDRSLYGSGDLLVVDGGTGAGLQLGEHFFVRRANTFGGVADGTAVTAGWITIVAVSDSTAVANIDHVCGPILKKDYLETFSPPAVIETVDHGEAIGDPDFSSLGRVLVGNDQRSIVGAGDFALIDRGTDQGVAPGARFAVYRDIRASGMPLSSIGEMVVVSAGETTALARVTRTRDAVFVGDYVVPRK